MVRPRHGQAIYCSKLICDLIRCHDAEYVQYIFMQDVLHIQFYFIIQVLLISCTGIIDIDNCSVWISDFGLEAGDYLCRPFITFLILGVNL